MAELLGLIAWLILWGWAYTYLAHCGERDDREPSFVSGVGRVCFSGFLAPLMPFVYLWRRLSAGELFSHGDDADTARRPRLSLADTAALILGVAVIAQIAGFVIGLARQ